MGTPTPKQKLTARQVDIMGPLSKAIAREIGSKHATLANLLDYWTGNALGWKAWLEEERAKAAQLTEEVAKLKAEQATIFDLKLQVSKLRRELAKAKVKAARKKPVRK